MKYIFRLLSPCISSTRGSVVYITSAFLCFLLIGADTLDAQILTVRDRETGEPIELVYLISRAPNAYAITNAEGQADISAFAGAEIIDIHRMGYKTTSTSYRKLESASFIHELIPTIFSSDMIVVSATRWRQSSDDIPSKIATILPVSATLQNPQTAADLLTVSGKVYIQKSQQGGGSPMIRGFATNRLLYTVDGVRMNTAIFRSGNIQNVISLDPFATGNTEVFFGPGSVIYGSDAIGGVMSFETLEPRFSLTDDPLTTGSGIARYSSANGEKTGHFDINIGWKKWASVTSISSNEYGNLRMGSDGPDEYTRPFYVRRIDGIDVVETNDDINVQLPSGYSQMNVMQKLRFKPNGNWDFSYGFHYSETSDYARYDRHIRYKNGNPRYGDWHYGPQKWMMNNFSADYSESTQFFDRLTLRLARQDFEESRISRDINKPDKEIRIEEVAAYSANLDFTRSIGADKTLFYGFEAVLNDVTSTGTNEDILTGVSVPGPSRYPQSTWESYAAYVTGQYDLSDKYTLQSGLRYNFYKLDAEFDTSFYPFPFTKATLDNGALTGSIGIVYRPSDDLEFSSNLATAFRSPNVDDVGKVFDSEPGSVVVPNPNLDAEYAYNIDVGVVKLFGEEMKIDVGGYYTNLQNAMVRRDYTMNGLDSLVYDGTMSKIQAIQNAAEAHVYGFQAGIELRLPAGFWFSSDFNFQKGEEELDDGTKSPSRHAPPWYGVSRIHFTTDDLILQVYSHYSGKKEYDDMPEEEKGKSYLYAADADGNPYSPGWYTINFKALYQLTHLLTLSAGLENITDQRYRPYSSGIAAPGRNFIISLKSSF